MELWGGNREQLRELFVWTLTSRAKHRREYPHIRTTRDYAHARFIRLRSPRATARWQAALR